MRPFALPVRGGVNQATDRGGENFVLGSVFHLSTLRRKFGDESEGVEAPRPARSGAPSDAGVALTYVEERRGAATQRVGMHRRPSVTELAEKGTKGRLI